ncbi:MAG: hypothetical protein PHX52_02800 [Candidatus Pacebacteria bacterium]|nr:hypothetical protein [Candidatus Paceibacterota bacterium]MDD3919490.1 hypothetical protein [Candidatus Paceibacterota bacterium]
MKIAFFNAPLKIKKFCKNSSGFPTSNAKAIKEKEFQRKSVQKTFNERSN